MARDSILFFLCKQFRASGNAACAVHPRLPGAGGCWSVQPPPEGPQQRLGGNAEQFVTEEASLV